MTDVTGSLQIVSRNEDGTFTVRMTPAAQETALSIPAQGGGGGFPVRINGTVVNFASAADYQNAMGALGGGGGMPELNTRGAGGGGGGGGGVVRTATDAAETVNSLMEARNFQERRAEFQTLKAAIATSRDKLASQLTTNPGLIQPILDLFDATNDAYALTIQTLEEQTTAAFVEAGIGAGRTLSDFMRRRGAYGMGGGGDSGTTALVAGGLGLGAGLLLSETVGRGGGGRRGRY